VTRRGSVFIGWASLVAVKPRKTVNFSCATNSVANITTAGRVFAPDPVGGFHHGSAFAPGGVHTMSNLNKTKVAIDGLGKGLHVAYLGSADYDKRRHSLLDDLKEAGASVHHVDGFKDEPGPTDEDPDLDIDFDAVIAGANLAVIDLPVRVDCTDFEVHGYRTVTVPWICDQDLFRFEKILTELDRRGVPYGTAFDTVVGPHVDLIDRDDLVRLLATARARQKQAA
jgi:hypothetical protein